jgi:hypothetical protein
LPKELAQVLETKELFQIRYDLTPATAFQSNKLSSFIKENKESVFKALELLVCKLALSVNVKHNIEPEQAYDIARAIYRKYYFYSVEEVALVLRMGEDGELSKIYDRLSKDMILDWFNIYDTKHRVNYVENKRKQVDNSYKQESEQTEEVIGVLAGKLIEEIDKRQKMEETKEEDYDQAKAEYFKLRSDPGAKGGYKGTSEVKG